MKKVATIILVLGLMIVSGYLSIEVNHHLHWNNYKVKKCRYILKRKRFHPKHIKIICGESILEKAEQIRKKIFQKTNKIKKRIKKYLFFI